MRSRRAAKRAATVLQIRGVQTLAAQQDLERSDGALRRAEADHAAEAERQAQRQRAWSQAVEGEALRLEIAGAWSGALREGEEALGRGRQAVSEATRRREAAVAGYRVAEQRESAAETVASRLARRERRRREEAEVQETADRFGRGARP
jgi:hypothetical protein